MRQSVIEIELETIGKPLADSHGKPVESGVTRVHPRRVGAALLGEEGIAAGYAQTLSRNIFAGNTIGGVQTVEETSSKDSIDAVKIVRRRTAGEVSVFVARPN